MVTKRDIKLGRTIRRLRRKNKLTQEELAEKVRVTPKYIQYIETARRRPSLKLLYRLAGALGAEVKDLFIF